MMQFFTQWLPLFVKDNAVLLFIASLVAVGAGSVWIDRIRAKLRSVDDLRSGLGKLERKLDKHVRSLTNRIDGLYQMRSSGQPLFAGTSPLNLTKRGREISKAIHGKEIAKQYADKVKVDRNDNAYVIQEKALDFATNNLMETLNKEQKSTLQKYAYSSGHHLIVLLKIIGIEMRDLLLKRHKITA